MPLIVIAICLAAFGAAAQIAAHGQADGWSTAVVGIWLLVRLAAFVAAAILLIWVVRADRPARFALTPRGFGVPFQRAHLGALALLVFPIAASPLANVVNLWRDGDFAGLSWLSAVAVLIAALLGVALVALARRCPIELTPDGITQRLLLLRRTIAWEALAPGGPLRKSLSAKALELAVNRPELVAQRGYMPGGGTRTRPRLPLTVDIHPWLLTDAIRWYVEHPADRAAIGSRAELDGLIARLRDLPPQFGDLLADRA